MNIAYLILAHNAPNHLQRLIAALASASASFFIHVDKKSNIEEFASISRSNVYFVQQRIPVYWGDFSIVEATLVLLQEALAKNCHFDRLVLLSGVDYPLRSSVYIEQFFYEYKNREFMNLIEMSLAGTSGKPLSRLTTYKPRPMQDDGIITHQRDYKACLGELVPYGGSAWWAISSEAGIFILDFVEREAALVDFFKNTICSDESFFQTILGNSCFKSRITANLTYADWSEKKSSPANITDKHLMLFASKTRFDGSEKLFARKFSDDSSDLVTRLAKQIADRDSVIGT